MAAKRMLLCACGRELNTMLQAVSIATFTTITGLDIQRAVVGEGFRGKDTFITASISKGSRNGCANRRGRSYFWSLRDKPLETPDHPETLEAPVAAGSARARPRPCSWGRHYICSLRDKPLKTPDHPESLEAPVAAGSARVRPCPCSCAVLIVPEIFSPKIFSTKIYACQIRDRCSSRMTRW